MKILKKIVEKSKNLKNAEAVTIAFLGDSVTQGCFECYLTETSLDTVFDERSSYSNRLKEILHILFPSVQINIINAGMVSPYSLYSEEYATFGEDGVYNQKDSEGFINLYGLPTVVNSKMKNSLKKPGK